LSVWSILYFRLNTFDDDLSSDMLTVHPVNGCGELCAPRGIDVETLIVFCPGWSVIRPSTTSKFWFTVVSGINCSIQLLISNTNVKKRASRRSLIGKYLIINCLLD
jgi:hypothetical protein